VHHDEEKNWSLNEMVHSQFGQIAGDGVVAVVAVWLY